MKKTYTLIFFYFFIIHLFAQQDFQFYCHLSHDSIHIDQAFEVEFVIEGANFEDFQLPDLANFQLVAGPFQSTQMSYINGTMSRKASFKYRLIGKEKGIFQIDPARILVEGQLHETNIAQIIIHGESKRPVDQYVPHFPPTKKKNKTPKGKIYRI